jgi:starch synthase
VLVPPDDPAALAEAVGEVLCEPEAAAAWAQAGGQVIDSRYGLEHTIDRTAAVYTAVLVEKGLV